MQSIFFHVIAIIERALRLFDLDVFTNPDDSGLGPFAFERRHHGNGHREYWGLGLHIVVSPLRVHPQS